MVIRRLRLRSRNDRSCVTARARRPARGVPVGEVDPVSVRVRRFPNAPGTWPAAVAPEVLDRLVAVDADADAGGAPLEALVGRVEVAAADVVVAPDVPAAADLVVAPDVPV